MKAREDEQRAMDAALACEAAYWRVLTRIAEDREHAADAEVDRESKAWFSSRAMRVPRVAATGRDQR